MTIADFVPNAETDGTTPGLVYVEHVQIDGWYRVKRIDVTQPIREFSARASELFIVFNNYSPARRAA